MNKILLTGAAMAFTIATQAQTINTFPYTEDFESQATCPTGCGAACQTLTGGWVNPTTDNLDWLVDNNGTSSSNTGPTANGGADHNPGIAGGLYLYVETSCSGTGYSNMQALLESPWFNFTSFTGGAELNFWYHSFGGTQGPLNIEARVGTVGPLSTWTNIGGPYQDNIDLWQEATICVPAGLTGVDSVQFRFNYVSGTSFTGDVAIDDITVREVPPNDAAATQIFANGGCGLSTTETIAIEIQNQGGLDISAGTTIPVSYMINGGTPVTETYTTSILLNEKCSGAGTETYTFAATADFSVPGTYNIVAWTDYSSDSNMSNDTAFLTIISTPVFSGVPYMENFESGQNGWMIDNTNNGSWAFGTPALTTIVGAASGDSAFVTNNYNANENSWVESPCLDISNANGAEWVTLKLWHESEFSWDGANLSASYDGGATWTIVGSFGTTMGVNWYTDNSINGNPGGSQEGWTGRNSSNNGSRGWICATHKLDSATMVNNGSVKFRVNFGTDGSVQDEGFAFDDFAIGYQISYNALADSVSVCDTSYTLDAGPGYEFYSWENLATGVRTMGQTMEITTTGTYALTVSDSTGMCAMDTTHIDITPFVNPNLMDMTVCIGDSAMYVAPFDTLYTYAWSNGASTDTVYFSTPGTVGLIQTDTATGCVYNDSVMLMNNIPVSLMDMSACMGDTLMLDATTADATYMWSTGDTTAMISATSDITVYVDVMDTTLGCMSSDTATLTFNSLPTVDLGGDSTICVNHIYTLDAGTGASFMWSSGETTQMITLDGSVLGAGTFNYSVTVTDANGCMGSDSVVITVDPCTGIDEFNSLGLSIYPNPTNGIIRFNVANGNNNSNVSITSMSGKLVFQETFNANTGDIDITELSKGVYLMTVESNGAFSTMRLIKE